jgi:hypothetical protein
MWTTNRHNEPSLAMAEMLRIPAPQPGLRAGASISGLYQRPAELCESPKFWQFDPVFYVLFG